jgi:hypothetical protein
MAPPFSEKEMLQGIDINGVILGLIAFFNLITAFLAYRTHQAALNTQANMAKVEIATNSMKDQLVKATGEAAHAAGMSEGLAQSASDRALFEAGAKSTQENKS